MSFPYNELEKEHILCNFCGSDDYQVLSDEGTDGLPLTSCICKRCGLIYINPRMTKEGYKFYYEKEYRDKTINYGEKGSDFDCGRLYETTKPHGRMLGEFMRRHLNVSGAIMEIGSGAGGVLAGIKEVLGREVEGLEPSAVEAAYAQKKGIKTHHSLIEDYAGTKKYAAILSTQALNHYLDPHYFFAWAHSSLVAGGIIVIEVMNFRQQLKNSGKYKNSVKIDHVFMFTPEVLADFVRSAGFEIVEFTADEFSPQERKQGVPRIHIRIIGKKLDKVPFRDLSINPRNFRLTLSSIKPFKIYLKYLSGVRIPSLFKKS